MNRSQWEIKARNIFVDLLEVGSFYRSAIELDLYSHTFTTNGEDFEKRMQELVQPQNEFITPQNIPDDLRFNFAQAKNAGATVDELVGALKTLTQPQVYPVRYKALNDKWYDWKFPIEVPPNLFPVGNGILIPDSVVGNVTNWICGIELNNGRIWEYGKGFLK